MVNIKKSLKETPYISFTPSVMWDFNGDNLWALSCQTPNLPAP